MRMSLIVVALVSAALGGVSARLFVTSSNRMSEPTEHRELESELEQLRRDRARLLDELELLQAEADAERTNTSAPAPAAAPPALGLATVSQKPRDPKPRELSTELNPEQRQIAVRHRNGALFREMGLSDAEISQLVPVLARQQETLAALIAKSSPQGNQPPVLDPREVNTLLQGSSEISAVLGPERAAQYGRLRRSLPARTEIESLRSELAMAGEPMSDEQRQQLLDRISARENNDPTQRHGSAGLEQLRADFGAVLRPEQLQLFDENQKLSTAEHPNQESQLPAGLHRRSSALPPPAAGAPAGG